MDRMRSTRPRRAEIVVTFSNDLGITIATPIRKALFGPPRAGNCEAAPCAQVSGLKIIPSNIYGIDFRHSSTKRGASTWSSQGVAHPGPALVQSMLSFRAPT
ncbi:hypothetical protein B296_00051336 [Ensete ventricosum]|uniref:Uncharacterized protein n=1 Tax=Ensete ventricosum TaxID=4639 RepID=A0A426X6U0_ENSVE|nr:hypothetical protein B296_00051336 [Ensete ventricosum]